MSRLPLISIITVVYNGEKYLEQTIKSVIDQTYDNIEYIIVDGGSTDNTLNIIKKYQEHISKWVSEPDKGLYDAMNKGIKMANGQLIGIINSDDWYEFNAVEIVVNEYKKNPNKHIFHSARYDILPDGSKKEFVFSHSRFKFKYFVMTYSHPSMFITKDEYQKHVYNASLKAYSDYQFVLEAFLHDESKFFYIPKALVNFRLGGISGQIDLKQELIESYLARKNAGLNLMENLFSLLLISTTKPLRYLKKKLYNQKTFFVQMP